MSVRPILLAVLSAALLGTTRDALAQRPTPDTVAGRATKLDPVRVSGAASSRSGYAAPITASATKTATPILDIPQSVTVIGHNLITDVGMQSMADVVRYVPGIVMAQGEGNRDQPTIRGNNTSSDLFIDGMRDDIQYYRDLYNIERVDAVTGPSAMIFGRGSGGGVLNRVTKQPSWTPIRELTLQTGSFDNERGAIDVGQPFGDAIATRLNGMYENSGLYRDDFRLKRWGINPVASYSTRGSSPVTITAGYEHFNDHRTADRGVPSFDAHPFDAVSTFFGDPRINVVNATVDAGDLTIAYIGAPGLTIRNHSRWAAYDKFYQNVFPGGAVDSTGTQVNLSAYNNAARRHNLFNQTDVTYVAQTAGIQHTLLAGVELGRQVTNNFKNTGYFNNSSTSLTVPVDAPSVDVPVTFRQSATDADNHNVVIANSLYAQDQVALTPTLQLVAGVRGQLFDQTYHNNRGDTTYRRTDRLIAPRAGLVFKPVDDLALYANYGISYLPSSGDQFSSLTSITQAMEPEKFTSLEAGAKWQPTDRLSLTAATYRLARTNTRAADPTVPTRFVQTGESRSTGVELSAFGTVTNRWQIAGQYTNQVARIVSRTTAAAPGATPAIVPHTVASVWNRFDVTRHLGVGLGVVRQSDMYAAVDNRVTLGGFTRADAAAFLTLHTRTRVQVNVENVFDAKYFVTADNDNNITPGSPRALRVSLVTSF